MVSMVFVGLSLLVSMVLKSRFQAYGKLPLANGMSGREVAEKMLRDNGIYDVQVISANGFLSDHYDPSKKTVNLSPEVYNGRNVASAAVAAHECGHAVQHATAYSMLMLRSRLVPVAQVSTNLAQWVILIGLGLFTMRGGNQTVLLIGIILFAVSTLFSIITLPVEFDASARALKWLDISNMARGTEHDQAKDALKWAALTYVIAALASIAMLVQYIMIYQGRSRN